MAQGTLMIVDDEEDILSALKVRFRAQGLDVITAKDGSEALALFERHLPEVVLMDVSMPKLDGLAALRELRELNPLAYVIMMSGETQHEPAGAALLQEASAFLPKPLDLRRLERAIQAGMRRP